MSRIVFRYAHEQKQLLFFLTAAAVFLLVVPLAHTIESSEVSTPKAILRGKEPDPETPIPQRTFFDELDELAEEQEEKQQSGEIQGQFIVAIGNDDIQEVTHLIKQGAEVNNENKQTGQTPLMMAESKAMARLLVNCGAEPKARDFNRGNVLHYAVTRENAAELIQYFTSLGQDPNLRGWDNEPAIFNACSYFHESKAFDSTYMLLGKTPDKATEKTTPRDVLKALIDAGADINARDDAGNTLLMNAVTWDDKNMVNLLLELGADKHLEKNGRTAKDMANNLGHRAICQLLDN